MRSFFLLFPPATEATFFPYLSLPALTAALRSIGAPVAQRDINLLVLQRLLHPKWLENLADRIEAGEVDPHRRGLRLALLRALHAWPDIWDIASAKGQEEIGVGQQEQDAAIQLIKRLLDLVLEGSVLSSASADLTPACARLASHDRGSLRRRDIALAVLEEVLTEELVSISPNSIVGLSIPFYSQIIPAFACSLLVRRIAPDATVVWGGPQVWLHYDRIRQLPGLPESVDALCYGQGESTLVALASLSRQDQREARDLPNLRWTDDDQAPPGFADQAFEDIETLPVPDFSDFSDCEYLVGERQYPLITCFGCYWGRCSFCSYGNRYHASNAYQEMSPQRLADICVEIIRRHQPDRIIFADENNNLKLIVRAARIIRDRGHRFAFNTRNRLDRALLDLDFCRELSALGCKQMSVGYETNAQRLLDRLQRGIRASDMPRILDNLTQAGIPVRMSVMGSILDETEAEMRASQAFMSSLGANILIETVQTLIVEPMTYLSRDPGAHGIRALGSADATNSATNFGLGRVGHSYALDEPTQQAYDRENVFLSLYRGLGETRSQASPAASAQNGWVNSARTTLRSARMKRWVLFIESGHGGMVVCDLSRQRFYRLPTGQLRIGDDGASVSAVDGASEALVNALVGHGLAIALDVPSTLSSQ